MAANERVSRLRERMLVTPAICVERAYYMTKSYQKQKICPLFCAELMLWPIFLTI